MGSDMTKKINELKKMLPAIQNSVKNLRKESNTSLCGPCPKCGGDDRFVYRTDSERFFCRRCNEKGGDLIDFHAWIEGTNTKALIKKYLPEINVSFVDSPIMNQLSYEVSNKKSKELGLAYQGDLEAGIMATLLKLKNVNTGIKMRTIA